MIEFKEKISFLTEEVLRQERPEGIGLPCDCDRGLLRNTICEDCTFVHPTCPECFIDEHRRNPFHWAHFWESPNSEFGRRVDISKLRVGGYAVPLGHGGLRCQGRSKGVEGSAHDGLTFTVAANNGVHGTILEFCNCQDRYTDRATQLLNSRLFPATLNKPLTAFTVPSLRAYRALSFRTKCSAHDYCGSLQRLADNVRPWSVSVSEAFFLFESCRR